ncbi:MAG: tripartite tricarboxylate transporter permease [Clostridium sp.]
MQNFSMLIQGFGTALTPMNIGVCMLGAVLGLIVGAMPGIGSLAGVALLLPLTYKFNPATAIIMLGALYYSNMYGGSFSAILLNIPGDSPAVCTTLDGYPMATKRKRPGQALLTANMASCIGGTIGMFILTFMGPGLANLGLKFGPSEMTAILLIAMTSISWLVGENPIKGVVITCFWYSACKHGHGYSCPALRVMSLEACICLAEFRLLRLSLVRLALRRSLS